MGLNETPSASRVHIGFFGLRNTGKSSLLNAVAGQDLAVVSEVKGTTTDPVYKSMELLPLGPVVIIDTPGMDDTGGLGAERVRRAMRVMNRIDAAVLVSEAVRAGEAGAAAGAAEEELACLFRDRGIPFITARNKCDLLPCPLPAAGEAELFVSARTGAGVNALKEKIAAMVPSGSGKLRIVGDLLSPSDFVVLVTPIDKAAPKGRLILPQQQTIRDILEADAAAIVVKEHELRYTLEHLGKKPRMVITDSQVFAKVSADTPASIPLTSFSILFARYKGFLASAVKGVRRLDSITDGDRVLICEGCTHHRQCDDIGSVKIPRWIRDYTGAAPGFAFTSGGDFPADLSPYSLIVHCGACMLNERETRWREQCAARQKVPMTNYGILVAHMQGILERSLSLFPPITGERED